MLNHDEVKGRKPETTGFRPFYLKIAVPVLLALLALAFYYGNRLVLVIKPEEGQQSFCFPAKVGDEWHYVFIHSVQKTPVEEFFEVLGENSMNMKYTRYQSLGVGLPFLPTEGGFEQTPDGHFIFRMNRPFSDVKFRTAVQAPSHIVFKDRDIPIYKIYKQGTLVEVSVLKRFHTWFD